MSSSNKKIRDINKKQGAGSFKEKQGDSAFLHLSSFSSPLVFKSQRGPREILPIECMGVLFSHTRLRPALQAASSPKQPPPWPSQSRLQTLVLRSGLLTPVTSDIQILLVFPQAQSDCPSSIQCFLTQWLRQLPCQDGPSAIAWSLQERCLALTFLPRCHPYSGDNMWTLLLGKISRK